MCGITGIFHFDRNRIADEAKLRAMTDVIHHRGPDGEGFYIRHNIGLGHRRLSIIDLSTGDQPMFNDDKSIVLVLNGEIYNYIELRGELIKLGCIFRTNSDTEVIIKAYEVWGIECQNKFNGMWAFALWDDRKKRLLLSRDRIGEKPLNYIVTDNSLIFSSEIKSVFEYGVEREIRPELIEIYLALTNIPAPDTFYKNIFKLKPGHYILADSNGIQEHKYWDIPDIDERNMYRKKDDVYSKFAELFEDSIKIRMRADVPFGAFLSGGLDSASIVSLMAKNSNHPIETFTIGFSDKKFDESKLAQLVANKFGTYHSLGTVTPDSLNDAIKRSVFYFDEPFGDSSAIPTYQVSKFASDKVKMILTGDGGDELLSGYNSYVGIKLSNLINKFPILAQKLAVAGVSVLAKNIRGGIRYKLNKIEGILNSAHLSFSDRIALKQPYTELVNIKSITEPIKGVIRIEEYLESIIKDIPLQNDFYRTMYLDLKHNLPDDYLVKVDRMSMANSIETRAPFLDFRLIEFMVNVDMNIKMHGWERKSVLRNTIGKNLPSELLSAPKKGFGVPLREWFKSNEVMYKISLDNFKKVGSASAIENVLIENSVGKRDNGNFIWTMIQLDRFLQ